jgi:hypothetical protein
MAVPSSDPAANPNPPKIRAVSPEKRRANARNARLSPGPQGEAKARTSRNAVSHGGTCSAHRADLIFLPDESAEAFHAEHRRWCRQLGAVTEPEIYQVRVALYQKWKQERLDRATAAAAIAQIEQIDHDFQDQTVDEPRRLIPQLALDPEGIQARLRQSSYGCSYLLEQFRLLRERLATHHSFEVSQRRDFLRLSGLEPRALFSDRKVFEIDRLYLGAIRGPGGFTAAQAANALLLDRPDDMSEEEFERRLAPMVAYLPTVAEGHAELVKMVEERIAELVERIELVRGREKRAYELAKIDAEADKSAAGNLRSLHVARSDRQHHAAMAELRGMQDVRRKYGEGDEERLEQLLAEPPDAAAEGDPEPGPVDPSVAVAEAKTEPLKNDATVPQVDEAVEVEKPASGACEPPETVAQVRPMPSSPEADTPGSPGRARSEDPVGCDDSAGLSAEELEEIEAGYRAQTEAVASRVEHTFGAAGPEPAPA